MAFFDAFAGDVPLCLSPCLPPRLSLTLCLSLSFPSPPFPSPPLPARSSLLPGGRRLRTESESEPPTGLPVEVEAEEKQPKPMEGPPATHPQTVPTVAASSEAASGSGSLPAARSTPPPANAAAPAPAPAVPIKTCVAVVGAGVSGLVCARALARQGVDVLVFEASDQVGGRVRTDRVDGFLLDRGFQVPTTAHRVHALLLLFFNNYFSTRFFCSSGGTHACYGSPARRVSPPTGSDLSRRQVFIEQYPMARRELDYSDLRLAQFRPGAFVFTDGGLHLVADPFRRPQDLLQGLAAPVGSLLDKAKVTAAS